jgi:hypothetical protein
LVAWGEDVFGIHSIEYDKLPDSFFLFHVLERQEANIGTPETAGDRFWDWDRVVEFSHQYGLLHVPVLFEGSFSSVDEITKWFMDNIHEPSEYGKTREGFVLRLREGFEFDQFGQNACKFVRANHVQTDQHWKKNWRKARIGEK